MLVGIVGAPNKGKSTIFSALTMAEAEIADYPFTTIKPNLGVAYVARECVHKELGVACRPRNSLCRDGMRLLPVNVVDVAGLVPGAHLGKGMGNQFLNDLSGADALIQVVDVSGSTDFEGKPCTGCDPALELGMVRDELAEWLSGIISRHMGALSKRRDGAAALLELLSGFRATHAQIEAAAEAASLPTSQIDWSAEMTRAFSAALLGLSKPVIVAANKLDKGGEATLTEMKAKLGDGKVVGCSGAIELALRKAAKSNAIEYVPGGATFRMAGSLSQEQERALGYMSRYMAVHNGTGVQETLNRACFGLLRQIVVYPVEDENRYTDHFGNALPDAILMTEGSTAQELAARLHTDLAEHMLYALDARSKRRLPKDYKLKDGDVIKIVAAVR